MNTIRYTVAATTTAFALLVGQASAAHADVGAFLEDMNDLGWYAAHGEAGLVASGYQVCRMLEQTTGDVVANYVYRHTDNTVNRHDAAEFVLVAVQNLCPQHDHRGQGMGV